MSYYYHSDTSLKIKHSKDCKGVCTQDFPERFADLIARANESGKTMYKADFPKKPNPTKGNSK